MLKLKKQGSIFVESLTLSVLTIIALIIIANHFRKDQEVYHDIYGHTINISDEIRRLKDQAPLVIVGDIIRRYDRGNIEGQRTIHVAGVFYFDIRVDSIERGGYPHETITVAVGMYDDAIPPEIFSPFLKKDYKTGDRIRIFVYQDTKEGYFTPALWYTIEPVS